MPGNPLEMSAGHTDHTPPEFGYVLDCAVEFGEITPLEQSVYWGDTPPAHELHKLLTADQMWPKHFLRNTARDYLNNQPLKVQYLWALKALPGLEYSLKFFKERVEFVVANKVQTDLGWQTRPNIGWIEEASDPEVFQAPVFSSIHDIRPDTILSFVEGLYASNRAQLEADLALTLRALEWLSTSTGLAEAQALAADVFKSAEFKPDAKKALAGIKQMLTQERQRKSQARSAIKKAFKLLRGLGHEENTRMLISGKDVTLEHPDSNFKFVVEPLQANWLEDKTVNPGGSVPFRLSLLTKEDIFLSRLCVYFKDTPVLDQFLSLSMFIQTGNEAELLKKANFFGVEDPSLLEANFERFAPELLPRVKQATAASGSLADCLRSQETFVLERRWAPYKGPVKQWLNGWLVELERTTSALVSSGTKLPLAFVS